METAAQTSIKASELRIGNWVNSKLVFHFPERVVYRPTRILAYHFQVNDEDCFHPIPLTPEILYKCGFVGVQGTLFLKDSFQIFFFENQISVSYFSPDIPAHKLQVYYGPNYSLHQLQNLYFALTGEELDIKFYDSRSNTTSA